MPLLPRLPYTLLTFLLKQYLIFYVVLFVNRLFFLIQTFPENVPFDLSLIIKGFLYGLVFDNSVICYALLGLMALCILSFCLSFCLPRFTRFITLFGASVLFFILCLTSVMGTLYYKEFGFFPTVAIQEYINITALPVVLMTSFMAETFAFVISIFSLFAFMSLYILFTKKEIDALYTMFSFRIKEIISFAFTLLLCIGLGILGARGSLGHAQLEIGRSVYSNYTYLNNFAANAQFTLMLSIYNWNKERKRGSISYTLSDEELENTMRELVLTNEEHTFLSTTNPLLRLTNTQNLEKNYNIVLVIMESFMSNYIGAQGAEIDLTPRFNALVAEGAFFENFYATGLRTNRGVPSILVSYPAPRVVSITEEITTSQLAFYSLPHILKDRGYKTSFLYGGDANFDNMKGFLSINGIDEILDIQRLDNKGKKINWGIPDDVLFDNAIEYFDELALSNEPFFSALLTISNHSPFDVDNSIAPFQNNEYGANTQRFNAFYFADWAIGEFIDKAKTRPWAKDTIFVFVADHGFRTTSKYSFDPIHYQIPLLFWNSHSVIEPRKYDIVSSQIDVLPTIMEYLGGTYKHASFGKNVFRQDKENAYAFISPSADSGLLHKDSIFITIHDNSSLVTRETQESIENQVLFKELLKIKNTFVELAEKQIKKASYRD